MVQAQFGVEDWLEVAKKMEAGAYVGQVDGRGWHGRSGCHGRVQGAFRAPCCSPNFGFVGWDQSVDYAVESGHSDADFVVEPGLEVAFSVQGSGSGFCWWRWDLVGSGGGTGYWLV